jgi:hypothetical protein
MLVRASGLIPGAPTQHQDGFSLVLLTAHQ